MSFGQPSGHLAGSSLETEGPLRPRRLQNTSRCFAPRSLHFSLPYSSLALKSYTHLSRTAAFFKPITFTTYVVHLLKSYSHGKNREIELKNGQKQQKKNTFWRDLGISKSTEKFT